METLDMNEGQIDQESVAIIQAAEDKSRNERWAHCDKTKSREL